MEFNRKNAHSRELARRLSRQHAYTWLLFGTALLILAHDWSGNPTLGGRLIISSLLTSYIALGLSAANLIAIRVDKTQTCVGGPRRALFKATLWYALVFAFLSPMWHALVLLQWPTVQSAFPVLASTSLFRTRWLGLCLASLFAFLACVAAYARVVQSDECERD